ncbi:uncharacterized protein LOC117642359 [Thrips palmi]|uniref:Uncharacterized protein LOC117642359 n=1 Tax=Thrips palmi TaxID=161013 RepID=A0A6P8YHA6_THRPL|nr:uncharacterized protein LOC117642359 [Thrips palmi]
MQKAEIKRLNRRLKEKELLELSIKETAIAVDKFSGLKKEIDSLLIKACNVTTKGVDSKVSEKVTTVTPDPKKHHDVVADHMIDLSLEKENENESTITKDPLPEEVPQETSRVIARQTGQQAQVSTECQIKEEVHLKNAEEKIRDLAKDIKVPMKKKCGVQKMKSGRSFTRCGPIYEDPKKTINFGSRSLPASEVQKFRHNTRISTIGGDLFEALYSDEEMALCTLTGKPSNRHKQYIPKKALEPEPIDGIIDYLFAFGEKSFTRDEVEAEVKAGIRHRLRYYLKKPQCLEIQSKVTPVTKPLKPQNL